MPTGHPKTRPPRYTFVPKYTEDMQKQVDATISLMQNNMFPNMEEYQKVYIRDHLKNLVETCLWLGTTDKK